MLIHFILTVWDCTVRPSTNFAMTGLSKILEAVREIICIDVGSTPPPCKQVANKGLGLDSQSYKYNVILVVTAILGEVRRFHIYPSWEVGKPSATQKWLMGRGYGSSQEGSLSKKRLRKNPLKQT